MMCEKIVVQRGVSARISHDHAKVVLPFAVILLGLFIFFKESVLF